MSLFGMEDQNEIKAKLTEAFCEARQPEYNCDAIKTIIRKRKCHSFLKKVIEEVEKERLVDKVVKRTYLQILETMLFDEYLYLDSDRHTEADYIVKLFGPILENVFRESGCRLLCWLHLKHHIKSSQLNLQDPKRLSIPFVLCEGLEADVYTIRLLDDTWTAVEQVKDIGIPSSISEVKNGEIRDILEALSNLKEKCMDVAKVSSGSQRRRTSMRKIYNKQSSAAKLLIQSVWKDPFKDEE
ncbi:hypothetical protein HPULCUR_005114 [Helicostylum pulchrum]|uniref:Uncharacterized protein n=1 Tax=Helicostylum pulchrum TaxID=562976 RepID=A0ABP9XY52_9FUNG